MRKYITAAESGATYLFALFGASLATTILSLALGERGGVFAGMSIANWVGYAITQLAFIAVVLIISSARKVDLVAVARLKPSRSVAQYLLLPLIAFATILAFYPPSLLFIKFLDVIGYPVKSIITIDFTSPWVYLLSIAIISLLPALGEELLCRGTLTSGLGTRGAKFSVLISALLFSLMHANPLQTVHQFGLGIVLAIVFILSDSLVPCVIIHFLNNFMTLTATAYIPEIDNTIYLLGNWNYLTGFVSTVVGLFLLAILLYLYYRAGKPKETEYVVSENNIIYDAFTISVSADESKRKPNVFNDVFRFVGSLFSARGWRKVGVCLDNKIGVPNLGSKQNMLNVWLAIGLAVVYWLLAFALNIV